MLEKARFKIVNPRPQIMCVGMEQSGKLKVDKFLVIPLQRFWCFKTFSNLGTIPLLNKGFNLKVFVII
jgi:hypothetical protein